MLHDGTGRRPWRDLAALVACVLVMVSAASAQPAGEGTDPHRALLDRYCVSCHNERTVTGRAAPASPLVAQLRAVGLALDTADLTTVARQPELWEPVVRKLRAGLMPPAGRPRPDESATLALVTFLEDALDAAARAAPDPGRTATLHRLNRTEYRNAVRDLLALEVDVDRLLPADDSSYGFDNIGDALRMSQSLLERYLAAAKSVSRLAVGSPPPAVLGETYRVATDAQQHDRLEGLPFGTRGGALIRHQFPRTAEYDIDVALSRAGNPRTPHELEIAIDGVQVARFALGGDGADPDAIAYEPGVPVRVRVPVEGGPRDVAVTFYRNAATVIEQVREPFQNPRRGGPVGPIPTVSSVTITGPHGATAAGDTPSRARLFVCLPDASATRTEERECARRILHQLTHRAYRGLGDERDREDVVAFYDRARADGESFESGIELALRYVLSSPPFLFRVETGPADTSDEPIYRIGELELASRLSFFLWSSLPDDQLLQQAEEGRLRDTGVLRAEIARMLADPRAAALTENFAGQWLQLRNLASPALRPGDPYSLAFDETLRQSMIRETELFFDRVVREDRPAIELLTADYTFLNERLATHYGVPGVQGSHFRRVALPVDSPRRGLLGHGSVLTVTSHAIRTSPVLRGKWILNNILGTPPPDPPPNVPALVDRKTQAKVATMRERMSAHRDNPACAACHAMIDPAGFALEHFDAIGRWREVDASYNPIDATGALPDGTAFDGAAELRAALAARPERFVTTLTEKLMTYALGRGLGPRDMPAVREILRTAAADDYRVQTLVTGIVESVPFQWRRVHP